MNKEVYKVSLGGVTVRLRNKANVCEAFLDEIFSKSKLDNRELLLILDDKNGFKYDENRRRACTTTNDIIIKMEDDSCRRDMEIIDLKQFNEWDAVVYVPKITTDKWEAFKPYFAFVLGHELEHVKVIRENVSFHMCTTWLFDWNGDIFVKAGIDCKSMKIWNFPLELHCNKKGKKLATDLFGTEDFDNCLSAMREDKNETQEHKKYLAFIMELEGEPYADNICKSICCDIRTYYYNNKLRKTAHEIWINERSGMNNIAGLFDLKEFLPLD